MDNNQPNPNNQNGTGISGFGSDQNSSPASSNGTAPKSEQNPAGIPTNNNPNIPPYVIQKVTVETTPPVQAQTTPTPKISMSELPTGFEKKQNFTNQTIVGGIEDTQSKPKMGFSMTPKKTDLPQEQVVQQASDMPPIAPSYNEVTASGSKNKFALIAIIAGVLLLLLAGGGYYYLTILNKPEPQIPEEVIEPAVQPEITQDFTIDQDQYIMKLIQLETTSSTDPSVLRTQIESLNFDTIDAELSSQNKPPLQETPTMEEPPSQVEETSDEPPEFPAGPN